MSVVPAPFLFHYTLPVSRVDRMPRTKAPVLRLPELCRVPFPSLIEPRKPFADLSLAWNSQGLALEIAVRGKSHLPHCDSEAVSSSDAVLIWIDTRDTQTVHRASRFCHYFVAWPAGGGKRGEDAVVKQFPVPRAREDAPIADPKRFLAESELSKTGYRLGVWLPAESLHGFDPATQKRLGFYLAVQDTELGKQPLTVGDDFPYDADPSLWVSLQLVD